MPKIKLEDKTSANLSECVAGILKDVVVGTGKSGVTHPLKETLHLFLAKVDLHFCRKEKF